MKKIVLLFMGLVLFTSCSGSRSTLKSSKKNTNYTDSGTSSAGLKKSKNSLTEYAAVMGVSVSQLKNKDLYQYIDQWIGTPHKMGGMSKSGVDCSAFVGEVYRNVYHENLTRSSRDMAARVQKKSPQSLKEGDLVFFSFGQKNIDHVGIYLQNNKFLHVSTRKGVIISDLTDSWYAKYFRFGGTPK